MKTKDKYRALQEQIETKIQDTFDSFLPEETKIKIAWYLTQDDESIYVDYHNQQGQEIGHNSFSVNDGATLGGVIHSVIKLIEQHNNWKIKPRNWFKRKFSSYGLIVLPKGYENKKKKQSLWEQLSEYLFKKR